MSNSESMPWHPNATTDVPDIYVDYADLARFLSEQLWHDADMETKRIVRRVGHEKWGRHQCDGLLFAEHVISLSCRHLQKIDALWSTYSRQHFGLSIQLKIYRELGGTRHFDSGIWAKFWERVGWMYTRFNYSLNSPVGHLPCLLSPDMVALDSADGYSMWRRSGYESGSTSYLFGFFFDRLELCGV